jgi:type II secretory ATPase GspE/PulE/Tfp pilus assembly ATPase PilB-like protein
MLTVPLKTNIVIGAIQVLNKERSAGTDGEFTDKDLTLLRRSPNIPPRSSSAWWTRSSSSAPTTPPVHRQAHRPPPRHEDRRDRHRRQTHRSHRRRHHPPRGHLPHKRTEPQLRRSADDQPARLRQARVVLTGHRDLSIEEVHVVSASLFEELLKKFFKDQAAAPGSDDVDIGSITEVISSAYDGGPGGEVKAEDLESEDSAPIIQLTNRIIEDAYVSGASDIHIEPQEKELIVRYRIDGLCQEKLRLPKQVSNALVTRLKIMCNLDIAERRLPQDGRIVFKKYTKKNMDIDLRVATGPMKDGEKVVMRILDKSKSTLPLPALGFSEENLAKYRECIRQPYGMILHCGPTGSGKSMTLYSALGEVNTPDVNIQTAEDPIEYTLTGINQMQMSRAIGLTFARALRCYLRMDPDIILVGEIRDEETAQIAVEAALTGHLLVSTLHTNDAPSTVARIGEMGVEAFNISASLVCVCAQRLLRRVCKNCKQPYELKGREEEMMQKAIGWTGQVFKANGRRAARRAAAPATRAASASTS